MNFRGCNIYANRDAGLVGQGFRAAGWDCKSILLAPSKDGDLPTIIRATRSDLENPKWWESIAERGVVFYNSTKYIHAAILNAAKTAGLPIAINVDNTGIFDFHTSPRNFWRKSNMHKSNLSTPKRLMKASAGVLKSYYQRFNGGYSKFAAHLAAADVIGGVTPEAVLRFRRFLTDYGQPEAAGRVSLIPHPVHPRFVMMGTKPTDSITFVTVGRWDALAQKRPDLLMKVVDSILARDLYINFKIFGKTTPEIERWHLNLSSKDKCRVGLHGIVPNAELLDAYQTSHVYLCVSAYESFLIAAAEALCCGCSIVACNSPTLPGPRWFASESRGTLGDHLSAGDLTEAALFEANAWREGKRSGKEIAAWAKQHLHADQVAGIYASLLVKHAI